MSVTFSIVAPVYNELGNIPELYRRVREVMASLPGTWELVLVSILLATILWGILGALIIVPVLASLFVIVDYLSRRVMGMPPFPPSESFVSYETPPSGPEKIAALKSKITKKKKH